MSVLLPEQDGCYVCVHFACMFFCVCKHVRPHSSIALPLGCFGLLVNIVGHILAYAYVSLVAF